MQILPETVRKGERRPLGHRRKYSASARVSAVLWVTYLSADWVAAVALGVLCNGQGDEDPSSDNSGAAGVKAFWAPILLVHLGGPDTITAYSVEDNELWTRHFLGAVVQVGVAFYVFLRSWTSETSNLLVLSVPVFVAGIIKYGERTWALRSASYDHFYSHFFKFHPIPTVEGLNVSNEEDIYGIAFSWFLVSKAICRDNSYSSDRTVSYARSSSSIGDVSAEEVFEVIEVELGFMFDALFTKASVIWSSSVAGCILRLSGFICSVGALVAFTLTHKHGCPTIDVLISYALLAVAVTLEIYAMVLLFFSDWAVVWLMHPKRSSLLNPIYGALTKFILAVNNYCWGQQSKKRWSRKVGQVNLISSSITNRRLADKGLMMRWLWSKLHEEPRQVDVSPKLMELIYNHVKAMDTVMAKKPRYHEEVDLQSPSRSQSGMADEVGVPQVVDLESGMLTDAIHDERRHPDPAEVDIQHSEMPSLARRVKGLMPPRPDELLATLIINRDLPQQYIRKELEKSDFRGLILVFHIATDLCIPYSEAECSEADPHLHRKTSELLSNYMVYLLEKRPSMLPGAIGKGKQRYGFTSADTTLFVNNNDNLQNFRDEGEVRRELHKQIREIGDDERSKSSSLGMGSGLAVEMGKLGTEKWERICGAWVEMLCFAAQKCEWTSGHAPQLGRGGELLTHVHFLILATTALLPLFTLK